MTYDAKISFGGKFLDRHQPEENWRADFETEEVYLRVHDSSPNIRYLKNYRDVLKRFVLTIIINNDSDFTQKKPSLDILMIMMTSQLLVQVVPHIGNPSKQFLGI